MKEKNVTTNYALPIVDHYYNQLPNPQPAPPPPISPPQPYSYPQQNYSIRGPAPQEFGNSPKPYSYPPQQNDPMRVPLPQGFGNSQNKGRRGNSTSGPRKLVENEFPKSPLKMANAYSNVKCLLNYFNLFCIHMCIELFHEYNIINIYFQL